MTTDRRINERVRYTFRKYLKRWVDLSTARKIMFAVVVGGGVSSATFGACNSSDITGPSAAPASAPSTIGGTGSTTESPTSTIVELVPLSTREDETVAMADPDFVTSTETRFETTEAVYNACMNEMPVLNGHIRVRSKLVFNELTLKYELRMWKDTRGVAGTATAHYDDDGDPGTPMKQYLVKYHNKETLLDKFVVGPAGLPFISRQESRIYLQREGDPHKKIEGGDDLFVYARQRVMVDQNGVVHEKFEFRTECK